MVDLDLGRVLVERLVGAFAGGRAINPVLVRSQLMGGMIWGVGHALVEETGIDPRFGRWMTDNLGEALVPVNTDMTAIDTSLVEEDDRRGHSLGLKGMGEIGTTGTAAAIAQRHLPRHWKTSHPHAPANRPAGGMIRPNR